jgi:hypothetical protein
LCALRFFVFGRGNYISGERRRGENPRFFQRLAAEKGKEPEEEGERGTENEASDDGEIESGVFAAVDDVAGKFAEAERKFSAEEKKSTDDDEETSEEEEGAAEFTKGKHKESLGEEVQEVKEVREVKEAKEVKEVSEVREVKEAKEVRRKTPQKFACPIFIIVLL